MYQECLVEFYKSLCEKIENSFLVSVKYYSSEGIHDLRVEVKRLKAFFNLIEGINPNFNSKKNFQKTRKLFKTWGKLRDIHVQQILVKEWTTRLNGEVSEYYNFLKQKELRARNPFLASGKKFNLKNLRKKEKKIERTLKDIPADYAQLKAEERANSLVAQLIGFGTDQKPNEEELHQIRILLKETRYTLEILQKCFPDLGFGEELIERLKGLHQILGKWHDDEMALQFLETFKSGYKDPQFFSGHSYDKFLKNLQEEKMALLAKFENKWDDFMSFLTE